MTAATSFRRNNPRRPVDWRWQRACYLVEADRAIVKHVDDAAIQQAQQFKRAIRDATTDSRHFAVMNRFPDFYEVWNLYHDENDKETRWEIEARILAGQKPGEICKCVSISPRMVELYEKCFFNVLDRLDVPGYITHVVMGNAIQKGISQRKYDLLWKMFGYWLGPVALDHLIYQFNKPLRPDTKDEVSDAWTDDIRESVKLRAVLAARMTPVNWQTQMELVNTYFRLVEIERTGGEGGGVGSETIASSIDQLVKCLPYTKVEFNKTPEENQQIAQYDEAGISLRTQDILLLGAGATMPINRQKMLAAAKYPDTEGNNGQN